MRLTALFRTGGFAALTLTAALPAWAAEGEGKGGMPQFDPAVFAPQLFWLAVVFAVLYALMSGFALPAVGRVIEHRRAKESHDLDKAEAFKAEADQIQASYQAALGAARAEAQTVLAKTGADISAKTTARHEELGRQIAARIAEAESRIAAARKIALAELNNIAGDLVPEMAARLAEVNITRADAEKAVKTITAGERV